MELVAHKQELKKLFRMNFSWLLLFILPRILYSRWSHYDSLLLILGFCSNDALPGWPSLTVYDERVTCAQFSTSEISYYALVSSHYLLPGGVLLINLLFD